MKKKTTVFTTVNKEDGGWGARLRHIKLKHLLIKTTSVSRPTFIL